MSSCADDAREGQTPQSVKIGHGGRRSGAGRKAGSLTKRTRRIAEEATANGQTPLDYMLAVMRDPNASPAERLDAAKSAAPYIHPRLAAIEHSGPDGGPIEIVSKVQRDAAVKAALRADT